MLIKHLRTYEAFRTTGRIVVDENQIGKTLEDIGRPDGIKIPKETCLAEGLYQAKITYSPKFKRPMIVLFTDPRDHSCNLGNIRFIGVRVHYGEKVTHTEGCVLMIDQAELRQLEKIIAEAERNGDIVYWEIGRDDPAVRLAA